MDITDLANDRSAAGMPDLAQVVLARDTDAVAANTQLKRVVSRQYLVRLLRLVHRLNHGHQDAGVLPTLRQHLAESDVDQLLTWVMRPEVTGWIWRMETIGAERTDLLDNSDALIPTGVPPLATVRLAAEQPAVPLVTEHGSAAEARLLAWSADSDERPLNLDLTEARQFATVLQRGADLLASCWPEGSALVATDISAVAPLGGHRGLEPLNFSIHGLRGFVLTSARPAYMVAQMLVHEATHQRFSGILDCVAVVHNPQATHHSPFVAAERPLGHLMHGILSFINDVHAAHRWASFESDPVERDRLARYCGEKTDQVRLAMKNMLEVAKPTAYGARLLEGCRVALETLGDV